MHDAQNGIDRIRIRGLVNPASVRGRLPFGAEIAPLHEPPPGTVSHAHICVRIGKCGSRQVHVEIERTSRFRAHEPGVAVFQHREKVRVGCVHPDGDTADRNHHAVALDLCG